MWNIPKHTLEQMADGLFIRSGVLESLMNYKTPFGRLTPPPQIEKKRIDAVQRALDWCKNILPGTLWTPIPVRGNISIRRTINDQTIEIFPLEAALMDFGMKSRFPPNHLPIQLNNQNACVRPTHRRTRPLHTDMIASMILLLGSAEVEPAVVPRTLHAILTEEQLSMLPPPAPPRGAYVPGQPSTTGRDFIPEVNVLELTQGNPNAIFSIQFEKRNGTLRNMTARLGVWEDANGDQKNPQLVSDHMLYDPTDYNLQIVFDVELGEYRSIATDRVTQITIGGQTHQTASAQ
jgi:hypothetical protein